jgi:hypothetical protein
LSKQLVAGNAIVWKRTGVGFPTRQTALGCDDDALGLV